MRRRHHAAGLRPVRLRPHERVSANPQPAVVYTLARETHDADLDRPADRRSSTASPTPTASAARSRRRFRPSRAPSDRREAAPDRVSPRWVGSGWTIFNNKGKPVRQYEPFFSRHPQLRVRRATSASARSCSTTRSGASSPRCTRTTPGRKSSSTRGGRRRWDVNDTVADRRSEDRPDVGDFFRRLPDAEYLPTWHAQRIAGALGPAEQDRRGQDRRARRHAEQSPTSTRWAARS